MSACPATNGRTDATAKRRRDGHPGGSYREDVSTEMLETRSDVVVALKRYRDVFDPKGGSVIVASTRQRDLYGEPFRNGFLTLLDERTELLHRMLARLSRRERLLLALWYFADLPVVEVSRWVGISRRHCYRLRDQAIRSLSNEPAEDSPRDEPPCESA
jgi:DNA-directed RNA polymerase specialized sigma24 family protein